MTYRGEAVVRRIWIILANTVAILFCLAVCALFVWLVGRVGFLGALVSGLVVLLITYNVQLEDGSAIGSDYTEGLYAAQRQEQRRTPDEWAARDAERAETLEALTIAKHVGAALVTIGALGFFFVQL
jgi:hypothetical protein